MLKDFPDFELLDQHGAKICNRDLMGKRYVVFCYPKDSTSGWTVEAAEFNASLSQFGETRVFGLSPDSVTSHARFATSLGLNFSLLADEERTLLDPLGVWVEKSMYGKKYWGVQRSSFLVGEDGRILKSWIKVNPSGHVEEVLAAL